MSKWVNDYHLWNELPETLKPQPMTPEQITDLVERVRVNMYKQGRGPTERKGPPRPREKDEHGFTEHMRDTLRMLRDGHSVYSIAAHHRISEDAAYMRIYTVKVALGVKRMHEIVDAAKQKGIG